MGQMQFPAGQRTPDKYAGRVGPNYSKWGEQEHNGYVYNPATDTYYYSPMAKARWEAEAQKQIKEEYGEKPPKQPSIFEQALATATPALAAKGGEYLLSKEGRDWLGGLLGIGEKEPPGMSSMSGPGFMDTVGDYSSSAWDAVSDFGSDVWDGISGFGSDAWDWLSGLFE